MISSSTSSPVIHTNLQLMRAENSSGVSNTAQQQSKNTTEHSKIPGQQTNASHSAAEIKQPEESNKGTTEYSESEKKIINELKSTDREVRAHEAAHMAAAGGLARGGASYSYSQGPDGQHYATGGEVSIDTSAVSGNPEATLLKAQTIIAAALAPANPSSADRAVAASASQMAASARAEILAERNSKPEETDQNKKTDNDEENNSNEDETRTHLNMADHGASNYQQNADFSLNENPVGSIVNTHA